MDEAGGERYLHELKLWPERNLAWKNEFGKQWDTEQLIITKIEQSFILSGLSYFAELFGRDFVSILARSNRCPPPPRSPVKDKFALSSSPELLFDGKPEADLNVNFVHYKPPNPQDDPYPPDWDFRRRKCLDRDKDKEHGVYCCRLCQGINSLIVHHVMPRSRGGSHSLQNLITLCAKCHDAQKYYGHDSLLEQAHGIKIIDDEGREQVIVPIPPRKIKPRLPEELDGQKQLNLSNPPTHGNQQRMDFGPGGRTPGAAKP
jgi:HNH endonuclease